ncbi:MAG: hypothetical protein R3E95_00490 [Thiolinea sp.]
MTVVINEDRLSFSFPDGTLASKYDEWAFYRKRFNSAFGGTKAVDIIHVDTDKTVWLIEVKDYRANRRTKPSELGDEIALKVRDTLAGLVAACFQAQEATEKQAAKKVLQAKQLKVVLHLEQPQKTSKLFPQVVDPADIKQRMKMLLKAVDAHPVVVNQHSLKTTMNWTVGNIS